VIGWSLAGAPGGKAHHESAFCGLLDPTGKSHAPMKTGRGHKTHLSLPHKRFGLLHITGKRQEQRGRHASRF
jgi:hypothetical protein